ncbi:hypothetical protein INS49_007455 [Diaporthe citri]|uniref:uncharacterized protein n=1 Tax=Diaporthe citri TaxID=83186 RepID=UPI001C7E8A42|nr:uncharacterized protein INS49_007455 [Diaporthe citri]KAG6353375.1 hypothetical protein INS49_007455 [Diaporthe citri]
MNTTVKADIPTLTTAADTFSSAIEGIKHMDGLVRSLTLQPYPISPLEKCISEGGNCTGLDPADGPLVSVLLLLYWNNASEDKVILRVTRGILKTIERDAASRGQAVPFVYLNYAFDFQDPIGSYGAANQGLLRETSKKYNPEGIFQKGVPGGFKVSSEAGFT